MNGEIDFSSNKFKDIEKKYLRNIDEWLANLYIEVKKFEIIGFQIHNEKIELQIPREDVKKIKEKKRKAESKYRLSVVDVDSTPNKNGEDLNEDMYEDEDEYDGGRKGEN